MEKEGRTRKTRSSKNLKKGGRSKPLGAEEEARRREEVRAVLREKLELERRALQVVERLLEHSVSPHVLVDCAQFITPANYKDVVEERSIAKNCGYPTCSNQLGQIPAQRYKISTKTNKVYDITERKLYCSNFCYKASKDFELQISRTPLWLRKDERPQPLSLMKTGSGSYGEEVHLLDRRVQQEDIDNPAPDDPVAPCGPLPPSPPPGDPHSSEDEQDGDQDFVSSVVSRQQGPRVHWGVLPGLSAEGAGQEHGGTERAAMTSAGNDACGRHHILQSGGVTELVSHLESCTLTHPVPAQGQGEDEPTPSSHPVSQSAPAPTETSQSAPAPTETGQSAQAPTETSQPAPAESELQPDLLISQVGMSRRAAAGLRDLLRTQVPGTTAWTIGGPGADLRPGLLEVLRRTLLEWRSEETGRFLCGAPAGSGGEGEGQEEEELDEDDLEDEEQTGGGGGRPLAPAPEYQALREEAQQLELRVKEFYQGEQTQTHAPAQNHPPRLPLVDSHSQLLVQKHIAVEKLTHSLRDVLGPLGLTAAQVTSDLNSLVRTFRLTNQNISHKAAEWTLLAAVLLHVLAAVAPPVREALGSPGSQRLLQSLTERSGLQPQDLLQLSSLLTP